MEISPNQPNPHARMANIGHGGLYPPSPDWSDAVRAKPGTPVEGAPPPPPASPETVAPNAAPTQRVLVQSQQTILDALRELKLPETPQNLLIAQTLAEFEQPLNPQTMALVKEALRGLAAQNADDVAALIVLLMHELPTAGEAGAALKQLMTGPALPEQLTRLQAQLGKATGQLDAAAKHLGALGLLGGPGSPASGPPLPMPGTVLPSPLLVNTLGSMQTKAFAPGEPELDMPVSGGEGGETEGDGQAVAGEKGHTAGGAPGAMAGTGRRGDQGPINRALGGAVGQLHGDLPQSAATRTGAVAPGPAGTLAADAGPATAEGQPSDVPLSPESEGQAAVAPGGTPLRLKAPGQPAPDGQGRSGGGSAPGAPAEKGRPAPSGAGPAARPETPAAPGTIAARLAVKAASLDVRVLTAAPPPPQGAPLLQKLASVLQLLRGTSLAAEVREPAHLAQQVAAMKGLVGPLQEAVERLDPDLHQQLAAWPEVETATPQAMRAALSQVLGRAVTERALTPEDEEALRQVYNELRKALTASAGGVKDLAHHLQAREQLTQANQVLCLPLALPGAPLRPVELLVESDAEGREGGGGATPVRMRLSVDTHRLGRVGIDLVAWQQKLKVQLEVSDPRVQALLTTMLENLDKALSRTGFLGTDLSVAIAPAHPRASILLPERVYLKSLRRIEGVV